MALALCALAAVAAAPAARAALAPSAQAQKSRITTASGVRLRGAPSGTAAEVARLRLGSLLRELGRSDAKARVGESEDYWYRVATPEGVEGWVFGALTEAFDPARAEEIYLRLAEARVNYAAATFADLADTVRFLDRALKEVKTRETVAELELARLLTLSRSFASFDIEGLTKQPFKGWVQEHDKEIVYSEPAGQYYVRSELLWGLQKKYSGLPVAERVAWAAAQNPLPGECEGYLPCMLHLTLETSGKYLALYPQGPHADDAAGEVADLLSSVAADAREKNPVYTVPPEDRADFRRQLTRLRTLLAPVRGVRATEARKHLDAVARRWR
ncbi:MAG TPA: SH3 domain-containing protein [Pyrinomonadaceae bacterium]|nr:SH3 domain-containing protein [Pyrinomonadaceae bacterium]